MSLHDQEWGDGHRDRVTVYTQATHRYKSQGEYTITIRGIIVGWRFGEIDSHVDRSGGCRNNLLNIAQWGCLRLGNKGAYFAGCKNFRCNAKDALDLKDTTNLASMFRGASSFTSDLSAWQTGQVTNMSSMFCGASSFTSDLSAWQTGQVTYMSDMFRGASSFTSDLSAWQTGQVTNMSEMFLIWRMLIRRGCLLLTLKWSDFCLHTLLRVTENAFSAYFSPFFPLGLRLHSNF